MTAHNFYHNFNLYLRIWCQLAYNHTSSMDYLDPQKQRRHSILLLVGYACMAIAIIIATIVLVYQAYGFGIDKHGAVIQNGIVFFSSQPNPAQIYVDGKSAKAQTNVRLTLPANIYNIRLSRAGYQDWQRKIEIDGGSVTHYDYPVLLPTVVKATPLATLPAMPELATQSPDRRWLLLSSGDGSSFQVYDLKNRAKPAVTISLPANLTTKAPDGEQWQLDDWADDNQHVLLQHIVNGKTEFVLVDRINPAQSLNLNQALGADPTSISLNDKKYDQYYLFNESQHSLQTASLGAPTPVAYLDNVLAYKSYGNDEVLYFTSADAAPGKVLLRLKKADQTTLLRAFPASTHYLVDLATYNDTLYVLASPAGEGKVYIYKDPIAQLSSRAQPFLVPMQVLRLPDPNYESFSSNAQYIVAEHGSQLAVYDLQNKNGYNYTQKAGLDAPQTHVGWMDGNRLTYVSGGMLQILDYDHENQRSYVAASPATSPFFAPDYKNVYTLVATASGANLMTTSLLIPADQ